MPYHQYSNKGHDQFPFSKRTKISDAELKAYGKQIKAVRKGQVGVEGIDCIAEYFGLTGAARESSTVSATSSSAAPAVSTAAPAAATAWQRLTAGPSQPVGTSPAAIPPGPTVAPESAAVLSPLKSIAPSTQPVTPTRITEAAASTPLPSLERTPAAANGPAMTNGSWQVLNSLSPASAASTSAAPSLKRPASPATAGMQPPSKQAKLPSEREIAEKRRQAESDVQKNVKTNIQRLYTENFCKRGAQLIYSDEQRRETRLAIDCDDIGMVYTKCLFCYSVRGAYEPPEDKRLEWINSYVNSGRNITPAHVYMGKKAEQQKVCARHFDVSEITNDGRIVDGALPKWMSRECLVCKGEIYTVGHEMPIYYEDQLRALANIPGCKRTFEEMRTACTEAVQYACPMEVLLASDLFPDTLPPEARNLIETTKFKLAERARMKAEKPKNGNAPAPAASAAAAPPPPLPPVPALAAAANATAPAARADTPANPTAAMDESIRNSLLADYDGVAAAAASTSAAAPAMQRLMQQQQPIPTASVSPMPQLQPEPPQQQPIIVQPQQQHPKPTATMQQQLPQQQMPAGTQPTYNWTHTPQHMQYVQQNVGVRPQHPQQHPSPQQAFFVFQPDQTVHSAVKQMHQQPNANEAAARLLQQQQLQYLQQQMAGPSNGRPIMMQPGQQLQQFPQQLQQPNANLQPQHTQHPQQPGTSRSTQQSPFTVLMQPQVAAPGNGMPQQVLMTIEQMKEYLRTQGALLYNGAVPSFYIPSINAMTDTETMKHFALAYEHAQRVRQQQAQQERQARAAPPPAPAGAATAPTLAAMLNDDVAAPAAAPVLGSSSTPIKWKEAPARTGFRCKLCVPSDKPAGTPRVQFDNAEEALDELSIPRGTHRRHVLNTFWTEDEVDPSVVVCKDHVEPGANAMETGTACAETEHCGQWCLDDDKRMHDNHRNEKMRFCCRDCFIPLDCAELSVIKHMRNKHGFVLPTTMSLACPLKGDSREPCDIELVSIADYRQHLQHVHGQHLPIASYAEGFPNHICGLQFKTDDAKMLHMAQVDAEKRSNASLTAESVCCPLCGSCDLWEAEIEGQVVSHFTLHALEWTTLCRFDYKEVRRGQDAFNHYLDDHFDNFLVVEKPAGCKACPAMPQDQREPINTKAHADSHLIVGLSVEKEKTGVIHSSDTSRALLGLGRL